MNYGFVLPTGHARTAADYARDAERAGWDGFFVWEPVWGIDAWVSLTAAAMQTERIRLGTMLTPLSRMRPWDMAGKAATLDNLSNGRVVISVGLGAIDTGFEEFGEEMKAFIAANRADTTPFDIVIEGKTPGDDRERAGAMVRPWGEAGATWWIEARWDVPRNDEGLRDVRERIQQGPPRFDA